MTRFTATLLAALLSTLALLGGCGGGVGTGGTGSFAQGTISGFGSIVVAGVRYDETAAQVSDADGNAASAGDLRLGMTVEIEAGDVANGAAVAQRIRQVSALVGPVAAVDAANGRFTVLGQTVQVDAATVFDEALPGGLAALVPGAVVEVYAGWDVATQRYRATRLQPPARSGPYRLQGVVSDLQAATRSVRIGSGSFTWSGATPAALAGAADGTLVRVQVQTAAPASPVWTIAGAAPAAPTLPEGREGELTGLVTAFTSPQAFSVGGIVIDASAAAFPDGTAGLAPGARVEVEGRSAGGVMRASKVEVKTESQQAEGFELEGNVGNLDRVAQTFRVRGVVVAWTAQTTFPGGSAAALDNGRKVRVKGTLSGNGTRLDARSIEFR